MDTNAKDVNPMTDEMTAADRAERIRRLQERRAGTATRTAAGTTTRGATKPRRRHPAMATRIFLAGLSAASFFTIAGSVAVANGGTSSAAPTPVAATPVVVLPATRTVGATSSSAATTAATARAGAVSASAPHVKSRGS